jgi:hypothetical protein
LNVLGVRDLIGGIIANSRRKRKRRSKRSKRKKRKKMMM